VDEQMIRQLGFDSVADFHSTVAGVDLSTNERFAAFRQWQERDGTKSGLLKLLDRFRIAGDRN
jgi:hypothetical protein